MVPRLESLYIHSWGSKIVLHERAKASAGETVLARACLPHDHHTVAHKKSSPGRSTKDAQDKAAILTSWG